MPDLKTDNSQSFEYARTAGEVSSHDHRRGKFGVDLSIIVVLNGTTVVYPLRRLYHEYKEQIEKTGLRHEFIFVIDGDFPIQKEDLEYLKTAGEGVSALMFSKRFGYAACLSAGFDYASGSVLATLPAYHQVRPEALPGLIEAIADTDMVVARRWPRIDSLLNRAQTKVFNAIIKALGFDFNDLTCVVRVFKAEVAESVNLYGDQHRFFPVLASHYGFEVKEVEVPQSEKDALKSHFRPAVYVRRLLDLFSIFFLVKFTRRPLRFFGLPGLLVFGFGVLFLIFLVYQRLYQGIDLADRPTLLLGLLLVVLGLQFFAIGLIGELVIFINARSLKSYRIEKIVGSVEESQ